VIIRGFREGYRATFIGANRGPRGVPEPPDEGDVPILAELAREAERIIDVQLRAFERAEDRSDRLMSVSLAVLGGGLSVGAFVSAGDLPLTRDVALSLVVVGAAFNLASFLLFLRASPGLLEHHDARPGPAPSVLARRAANKTWGLADHYQVLIDAMAECHVENLANLAHALIARKRGLRLVLCAIGSYAFALFLIAGSSKVA